MQELETWSMLLPRRMLSREERDGIRDVIQDDGAAPGEGRAESRLLRQRRFCLLSSGRMVQVSGLLYPGAGDQTLVERPPTSDELQAMDDLLSGRIVHVYRRDVVVAAERGGEEPPYRYRSLCEWQPGNVYSMAPTVAVEIDNDGEGILLPAWRCRQVRSWREQLKATPSPSPPPAPAAPPGSSVAGE